MLPQPEMFGRKVVRTTLDPIPRAFRTAPGAIAINERELAALAAGDGDTFKEIAAIVTAEDLAWLENRHG
ncbi:MAG: hypothetical protein Q7S17_00765 [Xanthobacteraceae bacterium]|nr:hypothetical protein [Xanthobacteraceae bacterium]